MSWWKTKPAGETINLTQNQFARWGIQDFHRLWQELRLMQLNSSNFNSANERRFKLTISLPYHHQSPGKAESTVRIAKILLRKSEKPKLSPYEAFFGQYNTPRHDNVYHRPLPHKDSQTVEQELKYIWNTANTGDCRKTWLQRKLRKNRNLRLIMTRLPKS